MSVDKNGIIIVNKDPGMTSHDVVSRLRRILGMKKIGHAGTLDPMATGVLPVCIGKTTRLAEYIGDGKKTYIADICFGIETDSYDKEGQILRSASCEFLTLADIEGVLKNFIGDILQIPPMVSAIKIDGKPLYKLAREGKTVVRKARPVSVYSIKILKFQEGEHPILTCEITCSKGTYIRSIAYDMGMLLNCGAHLQALQRAAVGEFTIRNSFSLAQIENLCREQNYSFILPPENVLNNLTKYYVGENELHYVLHGNSCKVKAKDCNICGVFDKMGLIGIGHIKNSVLFMDKVLRQMQGDSD